MRRLLVAGFAALAVLLGLTVTAGVAQATDACVPVSVLGSASSCDGTATSTTTTGLGSTVGGSTVVTDPTTTVTPVPCTVDHNPRVDGCQNSGPFNGPRRGNNGGVFGHNGGLGGHWIPGGNIPWGGPTLYGHQLWLQANLGLDLCGFGSSYDGFISRNSVHRSDIDRYLGRARWQSLYTSDCANSIAVVPNGLSLVNGQFLNLDLLGLQGGGLQSVCAFPSYDVFNSRLGGRFGSRWNSVRGHFGANGFNEFRELRRQAQCTIVTVPSSTTIVQQPAQTLEAAPSTDPAPAVAPSADDGASKPMASGPVPSGAVQTGGDSIGFVLAHNRAV